MLRPEEKRLALLAACARCTVVLLTTTLDWVLPDYDTSKFITTDLLKQFTPARVSELSPSEPCANCAEWGPFQSHRAAGELPSTPVAPLLRGWLVWDSVFFADIAAAGYSFEQYYAFFPVLPALTAWAPAQLFPVLALTVNAVASVISTGMLYRLGERLTHDRQLAALACLFFIFNPATIFHVAPYSEACFTAATLAALYWLHCRNHLVPAILAVAVSCGLRSNGVINAGYLGHYCLRRGVAAWSASKFWAIGHMLLGVVVASIAVMPLVAFQYSAYATFCRDYVYPEVVSEEAVHPPCTLDSRWPRPWCVSRFPYVYGFVQSEYWNVGFLRYWTLQQLPNFLLAAPVLLVSVAGLAEYCRANRQHVLLRLGLTPLAHASPPLLRAFLKYDDIAPCHIAEDPGAPKPSGLSHKAVVTSPTVPESRVPRLEGTGLRQRRPVQAGRHGPVDSVPPGLRHESAVALVPAQDVVTQDDSRPDGGRGEVVTGARGGRGGDVTSGYLSPDLAVFMYPWAFSLLIATTTMHVQVSTRFLLSACPPVYWYMAHIWLNRGPWIGMEENTVGWPNNAQPGRAGAGWRGNGRSSVHADGGGCVDGRPKEGAGIDCRSWGVKGKGEQRSMASESAVGGQLIGGEGERVVSGSDCGKVGLVQQRSGAGAAGSGWCAVGLWRWCLTYMVMGCVLFINFYPWT
ncbi:hypothetical protein VaNZ11_008834 [Volvox africanus]|uniref:GPI mannosyltransferase 2 n=1 Tax=Volvox africanus TaxID=51714 RepID=A0ABQ5S7H2_9CHLO|nr:hypothetical protein VaNZ11_008834 [Volvox africanus]